MFKLFEYLNKALVHMERRTDFVSKSARIWPSEASAVLLEPEVSNIIGGCGRKTYYRLIGEKTTSQMDSIGARRVRTGKSVERDVSEQAVEAGLHVASGVRMYVPKIDLAFELDLIVLDPSNNNPVICENKSIYGYQAVSKIMGGHKKQGRPKLEHILQTLIYINEIRTGAHLKQVIENALADRATNPRNRIEVSEDNLKLIPDDAVIYGKICYESRDTCETIEFDLEIFEDFDGYHYPQVNGEVLRLFTVESIYARFETIQGYYNKAQQEAIRRLQEQGVTRPAVYTTPASPEAVIAWKEQEKAYWDRVGEEMRRLPIEYLPPADYEYKYPDKKVEILGSQGLISITKMKEWKTYKAGRRRKSGMPIIGDWQCRYCGYKKQCVPLQNPELSSMIADMFKNELEDEEEKESV